ncbi:MAG: hypothetical protein M1829_001859 [Trizodia sp. TS-e1964]|nr:MAG: hypothetical protein M1829_001859 [Trizodia sp. TS-e1964]
MEMLERGSVAGVEASKPGTHRSGHVGASCASSFSLSHPLLASSLRAKGSEATTGSAVARERRDGADIRVWPLLSTDSAAALDLVLRRAFPSLSSLSSLSGISPPTASLDKSLDRPLDRPLDSVSMEPVDKHPLHDSTKYAAGQRGARLRLTTTTTTSTAASPRLTPIPPLQARNKQQQQQQQQQQSPASQSPTCSPLSPSSDTARRANPERGKRPMTAPRETTPSSALKASSSSSAARTSPPSLSLFPSPSASPALPPFALPPPSLAPRAFVAPTAPRPAAPSSVVDLRPELPFDHRGSNASNASIRDDPFFHTYDSPRLASMARELRSASHSSRLRDEYSSQEPPQPAAVPPPPPPRSKNRPTSRDLESSQRDINIAVVGVSGSGKTAFIQRALGLRKPPTVVLTTSQGITINQKVHKVNLIELDLEDFFMNGEQRVKWPRQISGQALPPIDGTVALYDVMNDESTARLTELLTLMVGSCLPTVLVACKCDFPPNLRRLPQERIELMLSTFAEIPSFQTSSNVPESQRSCLTAVLAMVASARNVAESTRVLSTRRRAPSSTQADRSSGPRAAAAAAAAASEKWPSRPASQSETIAEARGNLIRGFPSPPSDSGWAQTSPTTAAGARMIPTTAASQRSPHQHRQEHPQSPQSPPLSPPQSPSQSPPPFHLHPAYRAFGLSNLDDASAPSSVALPQASNARQIPAPTPPAPLHGFELSAESSIIPRRAASELSRAGNRTSEEVPVLSRNSSIVSQKSHHELGMTFDSLVDRLLQEPRSQSDKDFPVIFLCLYRKFAAPSELLNGILRRLEHTNNGADNYLDRISSQLRILSVMVQWVTSYPGDFSYPRTRQKLLSFVAELSNTPIFAPAASEMLAQLTDTKHDEETGWARSDAELELAESPLRRSFVAGLAPDAYEQDIPLSFRDTMLEASRGERQLRASAAQSEASIGAHSATSSASSATAPPKTVDAYEREAQKLVPTSTLPLTKFRYHIFMDISDDDFSIELTRIEWILYSAIRPRDLVRHVSLPVDEKDKCKSLGNINRMIAHFNHIAHWVSNMILMREKSKHRALILEKFMGIAWKLHQLNNFNTLGAILAGINGYAIHRLTQTRSLVSQKASERFMRLELLMGSQKSHMAYRQAWQKATTSRIPFLPLHRRDLVSAEEGNSTFVGPRNDRINWRKFEVMGEVVLGIYQSQAKPYPTAAQHDIARELILDCLMPTDEEEIYDRSLQLETVQSTPAEPKKFPWFQK